MIRVENERVETYGTGLDMLAEASIGTAEVINRVSEGEMLDASALLYTVIMGTAKVLEEQDEIYVNMDFIAKCIKNRDQM